MIENIIPKFDGEYLEIDGVRVGRVCALKSLYWGGENDIKLTLELSTNRDFLELYKEYVYMKNIMEGNNDK